jgi:hypothetical protein
LGNPRDRVRVRVRPGPPVYTYAEAAPSRELRPSCHDGALESHASGARHAAAAAYLVRVRARVGLGLGLGLEG